MLRRRGRRARWSPRPPLVIAGLLLWIVAALSVATTLLAAGAGYIGKDFMDTTLAGQPNEPFPVPPDIVRAPVYPGKWDGDFFMGGGFPSCPEPLWAPPAWRAGRPAGLVGRR